MTWRELLVTVALEAITSRGFWLVVTGGMGIVALLLAGC